MGQKLRWEYLRGIFDQYQEASRKEKGRILSEFCAVTGYNRKYALRLVNGKPPKKEPPRRRKPPFSD